MEERKQENMLKYLHLLKEKSEFRKTKVICTETKSPVDEN